MEDAQFSTVIVHEKELSYMEVVLPNVPIWRMLEAIMSGRSVAESNDHLSRLFDLLSTTITSMYTSEIAKDFDPRVLDGRTISQSALAMWSQTVAKSFPELKFAWSDGFYGKTFGQVRKQCGTQKGSYLPRSNFSALS